MATSDERLQEVIAQDTPPAQQEDRGWGAIKANPAVEIDQILDMMGRYHDRLSNLEQNVVALLRVADLTQGYVRELHDHLTHLEEQVVGSCEQVRRQIEALGMRPTAAERAKGGQRDAGPRKEAPAGGFANQLADHLAQIERDLDDELPATPIKREREAVRRLSGALLETKPVPTDSKEELFAIREFGERLEALVEALDYRSGTHSPGAGRRRMQRPSW